MEKKKIRWGILSTARIAQNKVIPAILKALNAEVTAIASSNPFVSEVASRFSIPKIFNNYDELLNEPSIDAVYIPLPNSLHKEWVKRAADQGKHILCEKPIALTYEEAQEMIEYCKLRNVTIMEAFMYQFHPQHDLVKKIIENGEIGEPKVMRSNISFNLETKEDDIRLHKDLGGGSIYDIGCYSIHSIRNILNSEPVRVHVYSPKHPNYNVDMSAIGVFELANGMQAIFDCNFEMSLKEQYEISGTKGNLRVTRAYSMPEHYDGEGIIEIEKANGDSRIEKVYGEEYKLEIEHFSDCLIHGRQPIYSANSTLLNMKVIDACYQSIKTGDWINL